MRLTFTRTGALVIGVGLLGSAFASAEPSRNRSASVASNPPIKGTVDEHPLRLAAYNGQEKPTTHEKTTIKTTETTVSESGYREISSFFNIREANANVKCGEWELELESGWETGNGGDDDVSIAASLKYGFTDMTYAELEVEPLNLGDGGDQGNGEASFTLFHQWVAESGDMPAFATWAKIRIPTGHHSSKVDGELHFNLTKSFGDKWRGHLEGYVMTANGQRGPDDERNEFWLFGDGRDSEGRRNFQWGIGPGIDYQCTENTIGTINYINRSSDQNGESNESIIEVGLAHKIADNQHLKLAVDVDVSGRNDDVANVGAKLQWSIEW